ncbi:MAG: ATP-binding protein [Ignavibacteria bacterium]|nr:ATP-binding protein [Ignavibacteria bacterium]
MDLAADQSLIGARRGLAYLELRDNPSLIRSVNECLSAAGVDANLSRVHLVDSDHYLDSLKMITQSDMAMSSIEGVLHRYEVYLYDGGSLQPIPMSQTGAGVSQMIPVIVALSGKRLAFVEQPELHLHPRAVRAIADYLVNSTANAQASINVIETHSTDLVFRVLDHFQKERADNAENGPDLGRSNVSVVFFERDGRSTRIRPTTLDKNGMVTEPWPVDFI